MLVNFDGVLSRNRQRATAHFNVVNAEMAKGIIHAAELENVPIIIGVAQRMLKTFTIEEFSYFLLPMAKAAAVPVCIHLDHSKDIKLCKRAVDLGFTSVMYDRSTDEFETHVAKMCELTSYAHSSGVSVEGELGAVLGDEGEAFNNVDTKDAAMYYTDSGRAAEYVQRTAVDALAVAVGTSHGLYKGIPLLDFDRIEEIYNRVSVPLVLHGGSGLNDIQLHRAVSLGIAKLNIFTEINLAAADAILAQEDGKRKTMFELSGVIERATEKKARTVIGRLCV